VDNSDPNDLVPRLKFTGGKEFFGGGPCTLQTKHGKDVRVLSSTVVTASTVPIEEWYTLPNGDVQPEWLRRLMDFCIVYDVKAGDQLPSGGVSTVGVPFRDLWPARGAARAAARAAANAALVAALQSAQL
jgi:hypothetical protein